VHASRDPNRWRSAGLLVISVATPVQEARWVLRAQYGDREALELLLTAVRPALQRYVGGLVGASDSEDVLQDILLTVYRKLKLLEHPEVFRAWMFRIASRTAFRHLKKRKRWPDHARDEDAFEHLIAPDPPPPGDEIRTLLASDVISPASRAVLVLHFHEELPLADVAAILEIPLGTVKSRLSYGLSALRQQLGRPRSV
jgi:RNA polymerase sigma-70 factor (ECF subfamily)